MLSSAISQNLKDKDAARAVQIALLDLGYGMRSPHTRQRLYFDHFSSTA